MFKQYPRSIAALIGLCCLSVAHAQHESLDTLTVTATRTNETLADTSSSATIITRREIEDRNYQSVLEALKSVPGVDLVQSGAWGSQTSVFMRGTNSNHTLIMIDGHEISDPSNPTGAFDYAHLSIHDVQQIEVVRGSNSSMYGSHAIGGVINIVTKKHVDEFDMTGSANYGTGELRGGRASVAIPYKGLSVVGDVSYLESNAQSVSSRRLTASPEDDKYERANGSLNVNYLLNDTELNFYANILDHEEELDLTVDDPNSRSEGKRETYKFDVNHRFSSYWDASLMLARTTHDRKLQNPANPGNPFPTIQNNFFDSERDELDFHNNVYWLGQVTTLGVAYKEESMENTGTSIFNSIFGPFILSPDTQADQDTKSFYVNQSINLMQRLNADVGMRIDDHSTFGSFETYHARASYRLVDNLTLRAGYSTGFRAPSLFELFGFTPNNFGSSFQGNPNLVPEESESYEFGFDARVRQLSFGSTYFNIQVENLIQQTLTTAFNLNGDIDTQGIENYVRANFGDVLVGANYTFTDTDNGQNVSLLRRPENKASAYMTYNTGKLSATLSMNFVGSHNDINRVTGATVEMPSYSVWNASANYQLNDNIKFFGRAWNLANKHYEPVNGFRGLERQVMLGVEVTN